MTVENRQATCEERISAHLAGRLEDFRALERLTFQSGSDEPTIEVLEAAETLGIDPDGMTGDDLYEAALERAYEYPLGYSRQIVHRIELSTGGPGDWLEVMIAPDAQEGSLGRITYHFNDWFDHAERHLDGDEYEAAAAFFRMIVPE